MRKALLPLLAAAFAFATPAKADQVSLLGFTGFDYVVQNHAGPPSGTWINQFDNYYVVGFVTSFGPNLSGSVNTSANEYTFRISNAVAALVAYDGFSLEVLFSNNARIRVFEDSKTTGTNAVYGANPPNATSPADFIDGTKILGADIDILVLTYDYTASQGNLISDNVTLDEGTMLGLIPAPQRAGWSLSGLAGLPNVTVPPGYINQVSGEMFIPGPTPTNHRSWGAIKALYR